MSYNESNLQKFFRTKKLCLKKKTRYTVIGATPDADYSLILANLKPNKVINKFREKCGYQKKSVWKHVSKSTQIQVFETRDYILIDDKVKFPLKDCLFIGSIYEFENGPFQ